MVVNPFLPLKCKEKLRSVGVAESGSRGTAQPEAEMTQEEQRLLGDAIQPAPQSGVSQSSGSTSSRELHVAL